MEIKLWMKAEPRVVPGYSSFMLFAWFDSWIADTQVTAQFTQEKIWSVGTALFNDIGHERLYSSDKNVVFFLSDNSGK